VPLYLRWLPAKPGGEGEQAKPDYRRQGPMRHDCHDGLGSRQSDPRADRLRGRLHRAEDVRRQGFMIDGHMAVGSAGRVA
jgi:hypothetical protein